MYMARLHAMILVNLVETFERYLKEVAAVCVDCLAQYVLDDRFNAFRVQGSALAAHFGTETIGRSLCESAIWLDCEEINDRFRKLLADPFHKDGRFLLFPRQGQEPAAERWRNETLSIIWQLRHTVVHNVGVITQSDAIKLRLLVRAPVPSMQVLSPTRDDIRFLKRFLDETAEASNHRIGARLAEVLSTILAGNSALFLPQEMADRVARTFGFILNVARVSGTLPDLVTRVWTAPSPSSLGSRGTLSSLPRPPGEFLDWPGVPSMMSPWLGRPRIRVLLANWNFTTLLKAPETSRDFGSCELDLPQRRFRGRSEVAAVSAMHFSFRALARLRVRSLCLIALASLVVLLTVGGWRLRAVEPAAKGQQPAARTVVGGVDEGDLLKAGTNDANWLMYGRTYNANRYSSRSSRSTPRTSLD